MARTRHPRTARLGLAALLLCIPACATLTGPPSSSEPPAFADAPQPKEEVHVSPESADNTEPGPAVEIGWHPDMGKPGAWLKGRAAATCGELWDSACLALQDHKHYYSRDNLALLAAGVAVAAPLAHTSADREVREWYQDKVRTKSADQFFGAVKSSGAHWLLIPVCVGAVATGTLADETFAGPPLTEWGTRSLRALLVGGPPVGVLQWTLGASRPNEGSSYWRPFHDTNAVSGHAFVGAVPILTAAAMAERPVCRYSLAAASLLPVWARLHDDGHYLSQSVLGWWMAYLAVRSVDRTETERHIHVVPACEGADGPGISLLWRY